MFYLLAAGNILMIASFILRLNRLPPQIPMFYTLPTGEDQLADLWIIFLLPVMANLIFFLNDYINNRYFRGNILVNSVFRFVNIFIFSSFTLIFIRIIYLVS